FEKVALDRLDLRHTPQLRRIASQDEDLRAASDELSRDLRTDRSRATGHEDLQSPSRLSDFDGDRTRRRPGPMPRTLAPALPRVPHDRLLPEARYLPNGALALFHARSSMAVERTRLAGERPEAFPFTAPSLLSAFVSTHSIRWPGAGDEVKRIWGPRKSRLERQRARAAGSARIPPSRPSAAHSNLVSPASRNNSPGF